MASLARRKWTLANVAWPYGSDGAMMIDDDDVARESLFWTSQLTWSENRKAAAHKIVYAEERL